MSQEDRLSSALQILHTPTMPKRYLFAALGLHLKPPSLRCSSAAILMPKHDDLCSEPGSRLGHPQSWATRTRGIFGREPAFGLLAEN